MKDYIGYIISWAASVITFVFVLGSYTEKFKSVEKLLAATNMDIKESAKLLRDELKKEILEEKAARVESVKRIHYERECLEKEIKGTDGIRFITKGECNQKTQSINQKVYDLTDSFCNHITEIKDKLDKQFEDAKDERKETSKEIKQLSERVVELTVIIKDKK